MSKLEQAQEKILDELLLSIQPEQIVALAGAYAQLKFYSMPFLTAEQMPVEGCVRETYVDGEKLTPHA